MSYNSYVRLRQICLATQDINKDRRALSRILDIQPCHSEQLDQFGLENTLFPVNGTFIELVAPTRPDTALQRFIDRSKGDGGYMAIFDCEDVSLRKASASKLGIDVIFERSTEATDLLQLNPRQTGVTLLEFDHHRRGLDLFGDYEWAGENWQNSINTTVTKDMMSITMTCSHPKSRSAQWGSLFDKKLENGRTRPIRLPLDYGTVYFEQGEKETQDHFSAVQLTSTSPDTVLANALNEGYSVAGSSFSFCGINFEISGL